MLCSRRRVRVATTEETSSQPWKNIKEKLVVGSIPVGLTFFVQKKKKKKKEEASPQGKNRDMWGEEAKPLN